jgi:hypothetical protein
VTGATQAKTIVPTGLGGPYTIYTLPTLASPDGITWTCDTIINTLLAIGSGNVAYYNGLYIVVNNEGPILTSSDGSIWTSRTTPYNSFNSVTYGNGQYVAVGGSSMVCTSPDGITWTSPISRTNSNSNSVTYGNGQYIAVGGGGTIINSLDCIIWTSDSSGTNNNLNSVTYGNGKYVAVGNNGTIIISSSTTAVKPVQKSPLLLSVLKVQARNSLLTISLPSAMLGKAVDLAVYSISGREIMRKRVNSGVERFTVPVSFSFGSYILVVNDGIRKASIMFVAVR